MSLGSAISRCLWIGAVGLMVMLLLLAVLPPLGGNLVLRLPVGWIGFLKRVGPNITVSGSAVGMVILCSVLIVCGIQWLCSGLSRQIPSLSMERWRWGWSVSLYLFVWLLFLAAMGITGFTHQLAWLLRSNDPVYVLKESYDDWSRGLREQGAFLSTVGEVTGWEGAAARRAYFAEQSPRRNGRNLLDEFHPIFLTDSNDRLVVAVVFHRDETKRRQTGFIAVTRNGPSEILPFSELKGTLKRYDPSTHGKSARSP